MIEVFLCIVKLGAIGTSVLIEYLFDELADRKIKIRVFSTGSKMKDAEESEFESIVKLNPDLILLVTPSAHTAGPRKAIEILKKRRLIVITNEITEEFEDHLRDEGIGYIVVEADSMIGARREFLDPTEMCIYNSDIIKVLSVTGVFRLIQFEVDRIIRNLDKKIELPRIRVNSMIATEFSGLKNPYARSKAMAAYEIASLVSKISVEACYKEKNRKNYTLLASTSHELMRIAAKLSDEAREIEKYNDTVLRTPHAKNGKILGKEKLLEDLRTLK